MYEFDRDISLVRQGENLFKGMVSGNWLINGNSNGGYLMALMANAVMQQSDKRFVSIFTASFLAPCVPGEADFRIEKIGASRQFERWIIRLSQRGKDRVAAFGTFMNNGQTQDDKRYERTAPRICGVNECVRMPEMPGYTLFDQMDVRLDQGCAGWLEDNLSERSQQRGWVGFKDGRPFDDLSLLIVMDAFPPPVLASHGSIAWVPTLEMSVNIRNRPKGEWLKGVFVSRFINNGIVEEDGEIWDEGGELIAISRQVSQFRKS